MTALRSRICAPRTKILPKFCHAGRRGAAGIVFVLPRLPEKPLRRIVPYFVCFTIFPSSIRIFRSDPCHQKKVLALVLAFACAFTMFAGAAFTDQADIETADAVDTLVALGVIDGYEDGSFQPDVTVNRAEMAKMIYTILNGGNDDASAYENLPTSFTDLAQEGWATGYIKYLQNTGIIAGKTVTQFAPSDTVTGVEAAKMMLVAAGYSADKAGLEGSAWIANTMRYANMNNLFDGVSCDVNSGLPRQYAAQIMYNSLDMENVVYSKDIEGFKPATDVNEDKTIGGKYMDLITYEGVLTAAGEFGIYGPDGKIDTAGKDKIAMAKIEKVNGDASVRDNNGNYLTDTWDYEEDVTDLVGQYVKVQTGKNDKVYGVFAIASENTVVTTTFSNVKQDGSKIKVDGTSYNYSVDTNDNAGPVYGVKDASGNNLYINKIADEVASGDQITFISNDGDSKFDLAIVNPMTAFGKVTYVDSEKVNITGVTGAFEDDDIIPEGLAKGDYVAVYEDLFTGNDKLVKADKVTGKVDATKGSITDVEIDGNWFKLGNTTANSPFQGAVTAKGNSNVNGTGDTLTIYSINGVAYQIDKESGGSTDTAFVIRVTTGIDENGNVPVRVLFADGSEKTIAVKEDTEFASIGDGDLVTYDMEGSAYELTKVQDQNSDGKEDSGDNFAGGDSVVTDASNGKFIKADKKITINSKSYRVSSDAVVYIQYQETGSNDVKYRAMTGAELNNLGGDFAANKGSIAVIDDGLASVVVLKSSKYLPGANADKMYGYVTDAGTTREDDNGKYREFTVWTSEGEEQVVKMKATSTSIQKGDLISFDMTADNFIEGVLSTSDGTNTLTVGVGAIDQFGKDYMVLFDGTDLTFDDDVKYVYANGEDGVPGDGLEQAYETADGNRYNNVKYVVDTSDVVMVALNTAATGWDGTETVPTADVADVVGNVASGAKATVSVKGTTTTINLAGEVTKGVPSSLTSVFDGKEGDDTDLTVVTLKGIIPESGTVSIKQENEALKVYYPTSFANGEKTDDYDRASNNGGESNGDYSLLIQEGKTATVTVSNNDGVIATYVVTTTGLTVNS